MQKEAPNRNLEKLLIKGFQQTTCWLLSCDENALSIIQEVKGAICKSAFQTLTHETEKRLRQSDNLWKRKNSVTEVKFLSPKSSSQ